MYKFPLQLLFATFWPMVCIWWVMLKIRTEKRTDLPSVHHCWAVSLNMWRCQPLLVKSKSIQWFLISYQWAKGQTHNKVNRCNLTCVHCECAKNSCHTEAHVQTNSMQMATFSVAMYISTV